MKIGDNIRVIGIPKVLPEDEMKTRELFNLCLGHIFPVVGIESGLLQLNVGEMRGKASYMESIYIEPEFVELVVKK